MVIEWDIMGMYTVPTKKKVLGLSENGWYLNMAIASEEFHAG